MPKFLDNQIPFLLKAIPSSPKTFFYEGNREILQKRCISMVGTRSITEYGKWIIENLLVDYLVDLNIAIVSGLARGIDAYVHKICLERDIPTIAIVPGAINSYIPKCNLELFKEIKEKGLVLAEFEEGIKFRREMFVLRNRLVAGISDIVIVIEAGLGSGSLITAKLALEYNRDVYVVPGNINSEMSSGCNELIKEGSDIITGLESFKEALGVSDGQTSINILR